MKTLSYICKLYPNIVTLFSPSWSPFSFSIKIMGPVDPSVENPAKNTLFGDVNLILLIISK